MSRAEFVALLDRLARGWADGDAAAVAACFAATVDYLDPVRYRFERREDLLPFFEPPPGGHGVVWHTVAWDPVARTGAVEYTYEGHHRYHGAAIIEVDATGLITRWREWQHLDDAHDWATLVGGAAVPAAARPGS